MEERYPLVEYECFAYFDRKDQMNTKKKIKNVHLFFEYVVVFFKLIEDGRRAGLLSDIRVVGI